MKNNRLLDAIIVVGCLLLTGAVAAAEELSQKLEATRVVDLTHPMHDDMAFWPGGVPFKQTQLVGYDQGYLLHKFEMGENTGTHVDAPAHFVEGRRPIEELSLSELIVPVLVIDINDEASKNPDYQLSVADIERWEARHGTIPAGAFVALNSGWHERFENPEDYINLGDDNTMHFPGFAPESAALLVERDVVGIGIDTLSIDHGPSKDFASHKIMLEADKYQVENLANLDALPATGATIVIAVLPVQGGSQAQARIVAFIN